MQETIKFSLLPLSEGNETDVCRRNWICSPGPLSSAGKNGEGAGIRRIPKAKSFPRQTHHFCQMPDAAQNTHATRATLLLQTPPNEMSDAGVMLYQLKFINAQRNKRERGNSKMLGKGQFAQKDDNSLFLAPPALLDLTRNEGNS